MSADYRFPGFPEGSASMVALPEPVFSEILPHLDDLDELKVALHVLWRLATVRSNGAPWVTDLELCADGVLRDAFARTGPGEEAEGLVRIRAALDMAVAHGILLMVRWQGPGGAAGGEARYLANSPQGRATVAALRRGVVLERTVVEDRPNIFTLYEQNVGALTALLGEELAEAEETYPAAWIEEAFREAVRLNKRSWKYILAILERWQAEGRGADGPGARKRGEGEHGTDRGSGREASKRDREEETRRYIEDAYDRLVRH
ncbi:MAG: DnaD domain protein [Anaerolineae bacterium]|jgi:DnaD/phage-associated family protein|nr:DnaD domain protein [Anaerolineae bacterium]